MVAPYNAATARSADGMAWVRPRGASCMTPGRAGPGLSVIAGGPSMMILIHRSWIAVNGAGNPSSDAPSTLKSPILVEAESATNLTILS